MYQPMFPLEEAKLSGFGYHMIGNIRDSIRQDFYFMLLCSPGEWPGRPRIGVGLLQYLFEPESSPSWKRLEKSIRDQVS